MKQRYVWGQRVLGIVMALVLATVAVAGSFTLTTTAAQDKKIHKLLTIENNRRASLSPPQSALTTDAFFRTKLIDLFKRDWRRARRRLLRAKTQSQLDDFVNP
jgi:hypothetical protein